MADILNIVIPMAGKGSRFVNAGYTVPKPLIDVNGEPMICVVTKNIAPTMSHRFIYICQKEHLQKYDLETSLRAIEPDCIIIPITNVTEGAACTVLLAQEYIDNDSPLMIANSDQYVDCAIDQYIVAGIGNDGCIMTMRANDPKWSYIRYDVNGAVTEVREKEVISDEATVGIYNFAHGSDFVCAAHAMIGKDIRVNQEFYVAPVYNELIAEGRKIVYYNVGREQKGMYGLGTPEDLELFLRREELPLLSVIVPFYNEERYLEECIQSILAQTYAKLEVILVDDGSTDHSVDISEKYAKLDSRVRIIHQKNGGLVCARKTGVAAAQGEYVTFVDGDDWIDSDRYLIMYERGMKDGVDIVSSDVMAEYGNGTSKEYFNYDEGIYKGDLSVILDNWLSKDHFYQPIYFAPLWKHLYKRELLTEVQLSLDDRIWMGEDTVVHLQCVMRATSFANVRGAYYHYRKDAASMTVSMNHKHSYSELIYDTLYPQICARREHEFLLKSLKLFTYSLLLISEYDLLMDYYKGCLFPFRKIKENNRIVIYGTGAFGRKLLSYLLRTGSKMPVMVCGADYGRTISAMETEITIENPEKIVDMEFDYIVVAATHYVVSTEICEKLLALGVDEEKICTVDDLDMFSDELLEAVLSAMRQRSHDLERGSIV